MYAWITELSKAAFPRSRYYYRDKTSKVLLFHVSNELLDTYFNFENNSFITVYAEHVIAVGNFEQLKMFLSPFSHGTINETKLFQHRCVVIQSISR